MSLEKDFNDYKGNHPLSSSLSGITIVPLQGDRSDEVATEGKAKIEIKKSK